MTKPLVRGVVIPLNASSSGRLAGRLQGEGHGARCHRRADEGNRDSSAAGWDVKGGGPPSPP
jgi:hypothetical protein